MYPEESQKLLQGPQPILWKHSLTSSDASFFLLTKINIIIIKLPEPELSTSGFQCSFILRGAGVSFGNNERSGNGCGVLNIPGNKWLKTGVMRQKQATLEIFYPLVIIAYHIVTKQCTYWDLGSDYFYYSNEKYLTKRFKSKIQNLGYQLEIKKIPDMTQAWAYFRIKIF